MQRIKPKGRISKTTIRVRYAETDAMGIVHHSSYIPWFELGRSDWMREAGMPYSEFVEMGYYLTVTEVCARYYHPAVYDELVTVTTWIEEVRSRGLTIGYDIHNKAGQRLVLGYTKHVCITKEGAPARLPDAVVQLFEQAGEERPPEVERT